MRLRDESLPTGRLLAHFDAADRGHNQSLLFLVVGAVDIEPLTRIEEVCRAAISEAGHSGFEWHAVPDQGLLTSIDPSLTPARVTRLEVGELADLTTAELDELLRPVLSRMADGKPELFPSAGGAVGAPAEGIQLLGREREIARIAKLIDSEENVLLVAPRRSGKTSVLRCLEKELGARYRTAYLDLERDLSPEDVAARLWVLASGERIRAAQQQAATDWQALFARSLQRLGGGDSSRPVLLLLDELVFFLQNLAATGAEKESGRDSVLHFLGSLSDLCVAADLSVIMAGSLDIREYLQETLGIRESELPPLLKSLLAFSLPPPTFDSALLEMRRVLLGTGLVMDQGELAWLLDNADLASPFGALRFLDRLATRARVAEVSGSSALEAELDTFLNTTEAFADFDQYLQRKSRDLPGARQGIEKALDLLARAPADVGLEVEQFRQPLSDARPAEADSILAWLLETFPLRHEADHVKFASRLFRRWWLRQLAEVDQPEAGP